MALNALFWSDCNMDQSVAIYYRTLILEPLIGTETYSENQILGQLENGKKSIISEQNRKIVYHMSKLILITSNLKQNVQIISMSC